MAPPKGYKLTAEQRAKISAANVERWRDPEFKRAMSDKIRGRVNRKPSGITLAERLEYYSIPEPNSGCTLWHGAVDDAGYGILSWKGRRVRAPRAAWEEVNGPMPASLMPCHRCDNPPCINVDHLFAGTHADNTADKMRKGRHRCDPPLGENAGSAKLTERDVLTIRASTDTQRALASRFGVDQSQISRVKNLVDWRHL